MFEVQTWERDKLNLEGICPIRVTAMLRYWQIDELLLGKSLLPFNLFCCSFANVVSFCWSMIDDLCKHAIFFLLLTHWCQKLSDPCCALKYYPDNDECLRVRDVPITSHKFSYLASSFLLLVHCFSNRKSFSWLCQLGHLQEIEGQIEADRKLQEKLILEDFGPSTAGRVSRWA